MSEFYLSSDSMPPEPFVDPAAGNFADKSFLHATLHALRLKLYKILGVQVELSFSDYIKQQWKLNKSVKYPRCYVALSSFELIRDRVNNRAVRTNGVSAKKSEINATGNYLKMAKVFPIRLSLELHYFESDMNRALAMVENLAIISAIGGFTYSVVIQEKFEYHAKVTFDDSISVPIIDLSNDTDPGSSEITLNFTVETYIGKIDDIARAYVLTGEDDNTAKPNLKVE